MNIERFDPVIHDLNKYLRELDRLEWESELEASGLQHPCDVCCHEICIKGLCKIYRMGEGL